MEYGMHITIYRKLSTFPSPKLIGSGLGVVEGWAYRPEGRPYVPETEAKDFWGEAPVLKNSFTAGLLRCDAACPKHGDQTFGKCFDGLKNNRISTAFLTQKVQHTI